MSIIHQPAMPGAAPCSRLTGLPGTFAAWFWSVMVLLLALAWATGPARAQDAPPPLLSGGDGVVSGFSGTVEQAGKPFIDLDGAAARIMALSRTGPALGQLEMPPVRREIPAREVGQVFGIAIDNLVPANVYLAASAAYGLRIVVPDADGDGIPEIALKGQPQARWMDGQWGPGAGPGAIWRVNGITGVVELFAELPNSGPGLGNIAYDPFRYQLFVSNLDDGLIYRLDLNGNILDTWDHGLAGRRAAGMVPVADDGSSADITSPSFSVENANTWGFTDMRRQVWGLAVHGDRLYYAVTIGPEGGPQIWSVGINPDGSLAGDARVEIRAVPGGLPVSDMLFIPAGRMILAQRGMFLNSLDNSRFHIHGADRVLRYRRDPTTGEWIQEPQEYAVGFPRPYRNASGGVALSCAGRLWVSGDQLRNDPEVVPDPPFVVNGLQRMHQRLVRPRNMPPFAAVFVDYDGRFGDARNVGHVGDVEIYRDCIGTPRPPRGWLPFTEWTTPGKPGGGVWTPPDLFKEGLECVRDAETGDLLCDYAIYAYNWKKEPRTGGMVFYDLPAAGVSFDAVVGVSLSAGGSIAFSCAQPGGPGTPIRCESAASFTLDFGAHVELRLRTRIPAAAIAAELPAGEDAWKVPALANCVAWEADGTPASCSVSTLKDPWPVPRKEAVFCEKGDDGSHECTLLLTFRNEGAGTFTGTATITDHVGPGVRLVRDDDGFDTDGITPLGWTCVQPGGAGTPVECRTDTPVTVGPGEQVDVLVTVNIPADAAPEAWRDCAVIGEDGPKACIDIGRPPRLTPGKERTECRKSDAGITCTYRLRIRNDGSGVHDGPLTITDAVGPAATLAGDADGSGPDGAVSWSCSQPGGAGTNITCTSDAPVRLDPGEEANVNITVSYPADARPEDIADCAFIEEGGPKACLPGDIHGKPELDIDKKLEGCRRHGDAWQCSYVITVKNIGDASYTGRPVFIDDVGAQTSYVSHAPAADWSCSQIGGVGGDISCQATAPVTIPPGGGVSATITTSTPLGLPAEQYRDCAVVQREDRENKACVDAGPPPESRLQTEKDDTECVRDGDSIRCTWNIRVTNVGSGPFSGDIIVGDMLPVPGASLVGSPTGSIPWSCTTSGLAFRCEGNTTLAPGESATLQATFTFPADSVANYQQVRNCAVGGRRDALPMSLRRKQAGRGNLLPFMAGKQSHQPAPDDNICERVRLPEGLTCDCGTGQLPPEPPTGQPPGHADHVDMNKTLKECRKVEGPAGEAWQCTYVITISKLGTGAWTGQLSVRDDVGPDVSFVPPPAGSTAWNCSQAGTGADIQCATAGSVTLNQGDAATLEITTSMPLDKAQSEENRTDCALLELQDAELRKCLTVDAPPSAQPRLNLNKESAGCTREGELVRCTWRITITNTGDAPYTGRLTVADFAPGSGFVSASGSDGLSWTCVSSILTSCQSAETTLAPGASTTLTLTTAVLVLPSDQTKVPNCALTVPPEAWSSPSGGSDGHTISPGGNNDNGGIRKYPLKKGVDKTGTRNPNEGRTLTLDGAVGRNPDVNAQNFVDNFCNPDSGMAVRPYPGGGCDCAIAQIPQAQPVSKPVCPSDTQTFPKAVQLPQGFKLVKTLPDGTQCARHEQAGDTPATSVPGVQLPPVVVTPKPGFVSEKPECRANERTLKTRREARRYAKRGWNVREVSKAGTTIWCATQPARAQCRDGWQPVSGADLRPLQKQGWRFYKITRNGRVVQWCGKEPARKNWCRSGGRVETNGDRAEALRRQGWHVDFVREPGPEGAPYWCVYGRTQCPNGWRQLSKEQAKRRDAQGWSIRVINGVYCGKPGQTPSPTCPQGYSPVNPGEVAALHKQGWSLRRIARNKWCGKQPDSATGGGNRCIGGTWKNGQCICPRGRKPRLVSGYEFNAVYRCVLVQSSRDECQRPAFRSGNTCACPRGMIRSVYSRQGGGRVVTCTPRGTSCPDGWRKLTTAKLKLYRQRGWPVQQRGNVWCGRPGGGGTGGTICRRPAFRSGNTCACPRGYQRKVLVRLSKGRVIGCEKKPSTVVVPPSGGGTGGQGVFCRKGFVKRNGKCVPKPCGKGFIRTNRGTCVPVRIDSNRLRDVGRTNRQRTQPRKCPKGTVRTRSGRCLPVRIDSNRLRDVGRTNRQRTQPRKCPKGTVRTRSGRCLPVRINRDVLRQLGRAGTNTGKPRSETRKKPQLRVQGTVNRRYTPLPIRCGKGYVLRNGKCVPAVKLY